MTAWGNIRHEPTGPAARSAMEPDTTPFAAAWSCVIDDTPAIWASFVPWLASLIVNAHVPPDRIFVHHVCDLPGDLSDLLERIGASTCKVPQFDSRFPHTNKIRQCATGFPDVEKVILTDVDLAFCEPLPLSTVRSDLAGKPVDHPCPPVEVLRQIYSAASLPQPACVVRSFIADDGRRIGFQTLTNNFNGGLYILNRCLLSELGREWSYWARWLIDRTELLASWTVHLDQVAFGLASTSLGLSHQTVPDAWNQPTHHRTSWKGELPYVLHHHARFETGARLSRDNVPWAQTAVDRVNDAVESFSGLHPALGRLVPNYQDE